MTRFGPHGAAMKAEKPNPHHSSDQAPTTAASSDHAVSTNRPAEPAAFPSPKPHLGVTRYEPEFARLVCERISTTPKSLAQICAAPDMPGVATVYRWLREYPDFRDLYTTAKQAQADILIDEALEIVDDVTGDVPERDAVRRSKLRVDFRKWMAGKLQPRKYGDRRHSEPAAFRSVPDAGDETQVTMPESVRLQLIEHRRLMTENGADGGE
jgi:hypothetical protein